MENSNQVPLRETVLIVEDDRGAARLHEHRLRRFGFDTRKAATADEAFQAVLDGRVDLILLDYRLPGSCDGLDFYHQLKARGHDIPVIMVTGCSDELTVIRALRAGVRDFVTKSVEYLDYLPEAVERVLKQERMARRLAESEARLAGLVESALDAIIAVDNDGRITLFNPAAERMFGCPAGAALGQPLARYVPGEFRAGAHLAQPAGRGEELPTALRSHERGVRTDGEEFPLEASVSLFQVARGNGCSIVARDITEQMRTEHRRAALYAVTRTLAEAATVEEATSRILQALGEGMEWDVAALWSADREGGVLECVDIWTRDRAQTPEFIARTRRQRCTVGRELPGRVCASGEALWLKDLDKERDLERVAIGCGEGLRSVFAFPIVFQGEATGVVEFFSQKAQEPDADLVEMMAALGSQIGQFLARKRAEARLQEQATLLDRAQDAILVRDLEDRITFWNQGAERVYGWTARHVLGRNARELLYQAHAPEPEEARRRAEETGDWSGELRQVDARGQEIIVESRWTLLRDGQGRPRANLVINTDITEKKKLEAQFLHAQRMESVGTLAGGMAHEFNNLLQAIRGYTQYAMEGLAPGEQRYQDLDQVVQAADRAASLIRELLSFGRRQVLERTAVDLNEVVTGLAKMLRPLVRESIELKLVLAEGLPRVKADAGQIQQVLLNLCINARDAMPEGGRLLLRTEEASGVEAGEGLGRACRYVKLTVSDTGCGMPPEVQSRIFEPFFTTKEVGKGTGLGLSVAYGIVEQHEGFLEVESAPGQGTDFSLYLPLADAPAPRRAHAVSGGFQGGSELILLAEDEPLVRELGVRMLREAGYEVLTASDGREAVELFRQRGHEVSLLLVDVVMPGLSGPEVYERVRLLRPDVPVLFCSGYHPETAEAGHLPDAELPVLQKPFDRGGLLRAVREALDAAWACLTL